MIPAGGDQAFYDNYAKQEKYYASQEYKDKYSKKKKKGTSKRTLPHPSVLSYPVAVSPDETNGSRLLIKCFKYEPPQTAPVEDYQVREADRDFIDDKGVKQTKGNLLVNKGKDGKTTIRTLSRFAGVRNFGASDNLLNTSHLYYIELPIPQDVNDSNTVTWGDNSLNLFQLASLSALQQGLAGEPIEDATATIINPLLKEIFAEDSGFRNQLSAIVAGKAFGADGSAIRPNTLLGRSRGEILNQNLELLFDSVNLRSFPFAVTFSPRNKKESLRVKHIIRALKSSMAAKKGIDQVGQGGFFLKAPDVFHLKYLHNGKEHPFLNSFKHCALTGMNVNYTNTGTFSSYSDGTPVSIQLNMTFKELNPIYQEDYEGFSANDSLGVGF